MLSFLSTYPALMLRRFGMPRMLRRFAMHNSPILLFDAGWRSIWVVSQIRSFFSLPTCCMDSFPQYDDECTSLFPVDITLAEARESVAGRVDFRETSDRDYVSFIYFTGMAPDLFPDPRTAPDEATKRKWQIRRECRGIIFHKDGHILSRRFQKFFNLGELPETQTNVVRISKPFTILEKLDGSMIAPFFVEGELRYCTKSGLTDGSKPVEDFVRQRANSIPFTAFCTEAIQYGFTPIFEWCSPKSRVVLEYKEESLNLLALRHMRTGRYVPFDQLCTLAAQRKIPVVQKWEVEMLDLDHSQDFEAERLEELAKRIQAQQGMEGFVIQQENGMMYKIKTVWYFSMHRSTQFLKYYGERHVWEAVLSGTIDDVKPWLPNSINEAINAFTRELMRRAEATASNILKIASEGYKAYPTRAAFNSEVTNRQQEPAMKTLLWNCFSTLVDNKTPLTEQLIFEWIIAAMLINTSSTRSLKKNVAFVGDLRYEAYRPKHEVPHIFADE